MKKLLLTLALLWPVTGLADSAAGFEAYKRGDYATAMREWRPLAEQGDAGAQFKLGLLYVKGEGVPQDYVQAYAWYNLAAAQGDEGASLIKVLLHKKMTPEQIAEAEKLSRELCAKIPNCAK